MDILITEAQIQERVRQLGRQIEADYQGKPLTIVAVLTGSLILLADLIRQIQLPLRVALLQASSYKGAPMTAGTLIINESFAPDVAGRDVLLLDDILDTGHTLATLVRRMSERGAASVRTAVLLRKVGRQQVHLEPDYCGFTIPDAFVVGYGLDYNDDYRHLPYVAVLDEALAHVRPIASRAARREARPCHPALSAADRRGREGPQLPGPGPGRRGGRGHRPDRPADGPGTGRDDVAVPIHAGSAAGRGGPHAPGPAHGGPPGHVAAAVPRHLALHGRLRRWLGSQPIDLAYVSMLKHDAYVAVGVGRRRGFPVVLRPEGAGATGDLAWQSWGRFGRRIGRRCRTADAFVSISAAITAELTAAGYDPATIVELPNGVPVPDAPWQPRPDWHAAPCAVFVGRLAPEKGLDLLIDAWPRSARGTRRRG